MGLLSRLADLLRVLAALVYSPQQHEEVAPLLQDNTGILKVQGEDSVSTLWSDSYSVGDHCFCSTNFAERSDSLGSVTVGTPLGGLTVLEICDLLGPGPGLDSGTYPTYNDIQCGNGPPKDTRVEHTCPGRTDHGSEGCGYIGPTWNFDDLLQEEGPTIPDPASAPALVPTLSLITPSPVPAPSQSPSKPVMSSTMTPSMSRTTLTPSSTILTENPGAEPALSLLFVLAPFLLSTPEPTSAPPSATPTLRPSAREKSDPPTNSPSNSNTTGMQPNISIPTSSPTEVPTEAPTTALVETSIADEQEEAISTTCSFHEDTDLLGDGSILFRQFVNSAASTVTIEMEYMGVGWVGMGFGSSMVNTMAIVGLPDQDIVEQTYLGAKYPSGIVVADSQTLTDAIVTQVGGFTTMTFTKPLVETGQPDVVVGDNSIVWAVGRQNSFGYHGYRGTVVVAFDDCI